MPQAIKGVRKLGLLAVMLAMAALALPALASCGNSGGTPRAPGEEVSYRDTTPVVLEVSQPGTAVAAEDAAVLDYSNAADGYICAMSNLEGIKVKVLVDVAGTQYQYTIEGPGYYITIPLSQGNNSYAVGIWQNVKDDSYTPILSQNIDVTLNDEYTPFLYPSQYVNFAAGDASTTLSAQLSEGSSTDVDVVNSIYTWVCDNIDYDKTKATTVASGYLPNNTNTINSGEGICFDYAVLTASMLRAQRVPTKLVIGYAGSAYHAWIEVYCVDTGTVFSYNFTGNDWERMDPTFDAASGGAQDLSAYIGDGHEYTPMLYY